MEGSVGKTRNYNTWVPSSTQRKCIVQIHTLCMRPHPLPPLEGPPAQNCCPPLILTPPTWCEKWAQVLWIWGKGRGEGGERKACCTCQFQRSRNVPLFILNTLYTNPWEIRPPHTHLNHNNIRIFKKKVQIKIICQQECWFIYCTMKTSFNHL